MNVSILNGCECQVTQRDRQLLRQLDSLYAFYHKQWWCYRELYRYYKRWRTVLNAMTLLIVALGMIVGPVFKNSVAATCITAVGMMVKGWNDFKKFSLKMDMCRFAYTSYAKTLSELRTHVRGSPFGRIRGIFGQNPNHRRHRHRFHTHITRSLSHFL